MDSQFDIDKGFAIGEAYLADMGYQKLQAQKKGCKFCDEADMKILRVIIYNLRHRTGRGVYDETTQFWYSFMLDYIPAIGYDEYYTRVENSLIIGDLYSVSTISDGMEAGAGIYINPLFAGQTDFRVYSRNLNAILNFDQHGWLRFAAGGFTWDITKFVLEPGDELVIGTDVDLLGLITT